MSAMKTPTAAQAVAWAHMILLVPKMVSALRLALPLVREQAAKTEGRSAIEQARASKALSAVEDVVERINRASGPSKKTVWRKK